MAVRDIRTRLSLDGEQEFSRAIQAANRNLRVMDSELKAASAAFDETGDRQAYLTTRSRTLSSEIQQQERIIEALTQAVKDSADKYGDADKRTDGYRIKLNNATQALSRMRKQLQDTDREAEELGRDSTRVGRQIEDGIGEGARQAGRELDDMIQDLQSSVKSIDIKTTIEMGVEGLGSVKEAISSVMSFAEETREERRQNAFFDFNAQGAGYDESFLDEQRIKVAAITGEMEGAYEGLNNLMQIGFSESDFEKAVDSILGTVIKTGNETLKFENIAESLQETLATGSATGAYAEMLERRGYDLKTFNEALENSKTSAGDLQIALGYLTEGDSIGFLEKFKAYNQALIDAETATIKLNEAMNGLGDIADQATTPIKEKLAEGITEATAYFDALATDGLNFEGDAWRDYFDKYGDTIITSAVKVAQSIPEEIQDIGDFLETASFGEVVDAAEAKLSGIWERLEQKTKEGYEKTAENAMTAVTDESEALREQLYALDEAISTAYNSRDYLTYWELIDQRNTLLESIAQMEAEAGAAAGEAGAAAMDAMNQGVIDNAGAVEGSAGTIGSNIGIELGNGIAGSAPYTISQTAMMVDGVLAELSRVNSTTVSPKYSAPSSSGGGSKAGTTTTLVVNANIDGRTAATALVPYIDEEMGYQMSRNA